MVRQMVPPLLSIPLAGGETLNIWQDHLEASGPVFSLRALTNAGLVTLPSPQGGQQPGVAAVGVWDRRGHYAFFVPADPADASRVVAAIYEARPDLRAHGLRGLPRGIRRSDGPAQDGVAGSVAGSVAGGVAEAMGDGGERLVAGVAHLSVLFFPLLLPLILWLGTARSMPYASRQARQAFLFHLSILALDGLLIVALLVTSLGSLFGSAASGNPGGVGIGVLALVIGGLGVLGITLFGAGYSIFAAIETFQGRPFSYPLLRRL